MKIRTRLLSLCLILFLFYSCTNQHPVQETTFTTMGTATATETIPLISDDAKQLLQQYGDYAVHGIVPNMKFGDVEAILGPLERSDGSAEYAYQNISIGGISINEETNRPDADNRIRFINIHNGASLGLTIGASSKEDAEKRFANYEKNSSEEYSEFYVADGIKIVVGYHERILSDDKRDTVVAGIIILAR